MANQMNDPGARKSKLAVPAEYERIDERATKSDVTAGPWIGQRRSDMTCRSKPSAVHVRNLTCATASAAPI